MTLPDFNPMPVYVILGATGGIGSTLCKRLAKNQAASLVLGGRRAEPLESLAKELNGHALAGDATDPAYVDKLVERARELHGRIDGLVNCVGSILLKPAHLTSPEEFQQTLSTNLVSAFSCVRAGANAMRETGGSIVLLGTAASLIGLPNHEAIAAAKAGITGLALSAAASYAARNIRVNVVAPGLTKTPLTTRLTQNEASAKASIAMHPLGRLGEPEDVARAIEFFLDPCNSWVTGQVLAVDGGLSTLKTRG
jgi:NAD(P)-dependent dehydrogenase (short-subunit alcohol dehydrogenase family)